MEHNYLIYRHLEFDSEEQLCEHLQTLKQGDVARVHYEIGELREKNGVKVKLEGRIVAVSNGDMMVTPHPNNEAVGAATESSFTDNDLVLLYDEAEAAELVKQRNVIWIRDFEVNHLYKQEVIKENSDAKHMLTNFDA